MSELVVTPAVNKVTKLETQRFNLNLSGITNAMLADRTFSSMSPAADLLQLPSYSRTILFANLLDKLLLQDLNASLDKEVDNVYTEPQDLLEALLTREDTAILLTYIRQRRDYCAALETLTKHNLSGFEWWVMENPTIRNTTFVLYGDYRIVQWEEDHIVKSAKDYNTNGTYT